MPFKQTTELILKTTLVDAILAALSAQPGAALLSVPTARLFTNDFVPDADSVPADFTEATFDGYAADALGTLLGPVTLTNGSRALHAEVDFIAGAAAAAPGEVIHGVYVTNAAGTTLYGSSRFDDPVPIVVPGDFLSLDIVIPEPPARTAA